ncbi:unnamed protein product, partial [Mesorhabditis spiculigera]
MPNEARQRKPKDTPESPSKKPPSDEKSKGPSQPPGACGEVFSKFVDSFNAALNSVVDEPAVCSTRRLKALTIEGVAEYIKKEKPKNIIVMSGAGISTSAGIPDFRSPGSGLYDNLQKYKLPHPQAIFEIDFFDENPEPFFTLARELFPERLKPTVCHQFVSLLDKKGLLQRWYTQNIDSLEYLTGISEDKDFPKCDLLLILGTSLVVQPFASMAHEVDSECPRLLVNLEEVGRSSRAEERMGIQGLCYGKHGNSRDVFWKGTCDDGARKLAELLGWDAELEILVEQAPTLLPTRKQ